MRIESILMSLPLTAHWEYMHAEPGSPEDKMNTQYSDLLLPIPAGYYPVVGFPAMIFFSYFLHVSDVL